LDIDSNRTWGELAMKMLGISKFARLFAVFVVTLVGTDLLLAAASLTAVAEEKQQSQASRIENSTKINKRFFRVKKDLFGNTLETVPVRCTRGGGCSDDDCCGWNAEGACTACYTEAGDEDDRRERRSRRPRSPN
jgi:hypothetical protein